MPWDLANLDASCSRLWGWPLAAALALTAQLSTAHAQPQDGLEMVLSCPKGANSPDLPSNPQTTVVNASFGGNNCTVFYANRSNGPLTNLRFIIRSERLLPDVPLVVEPLENPDGSNAQYYAHEVADSLDDPQAWYGQRDSGWTILRNHSVASQFVGPSGTPGVTAGGTVEDPRNVVVPGVGVRPFYNAQTVMVSSLAAGSTGEFTFSYTASRYPDPTDTTEGYITVEFAGADEPDIDPPELQAARVNVTSGATTAITAFGTRALTNATSFSSSARSNAGDVIPTSWQDLYLPYLDDDSGEIFADEFYDPLEDTLVYSLTAGTITGRACFFSCWTVELDLSVSTSGPPAGANANQALYVVPNSNRVRFNSGLVSHVTPHDLRYELQLNPAVDPLVRLDGFEFPSGRWCIEDFTGTRRCATSVIEMVEFPLEAEPFLDLYPFGTNQNANAWLEGFAIWPNRHLRVDVAVGVGTWTALTEVQDLEVTFQPFGAEDRDVDLARVYIWLGGIVDSAAHQIWVHFDADDASAYGHEGSLLNRTLKPSNDPGWVLCRSNPIGSRGECNAATISALGIGRTIAEVDQVRVVFPSVPANTEGSFRIYSDGTARGARPSIDGNADVVGEYVPTNMEQSSVGGIARVAFTAGPDSVPFAGQAASHAEFDPRYRGAISRFWYGTGVSPGGLTQEQVALNGNFPMGPRWLSIYEAPAFTPVVMTIDLSSAPTYIFEGPLDSSLRVLDFATQPLIGFDWSYTWDPIARLITVTIVGENGDPTPIPGASDPGRIDGSVSGPTGFFVELRGRFTPGPSVQTVRGSLAFDYEDLGVMRTEGSVIGSTYTIVGGVPVLRVEGTASKAIIEKNGELDLQLQAYNDAFGADGLPMTDALGATGEAKDAAVFYRVNDDGDFDPTPGEGGVADLEFVRAQSDDALAIYVATREDPLVASSQNLNLANGWILCSSGGAPCDSAALQALPTPLTPEAVRWVAVAYGTLSITDVVPRGAPGSSQPYVAAITLRTTSDVTDGAFLFANIEAASSNTSSPTIGGVTTVEIDADCDASLPGVGFDEDEICDEYDNDCDGEINEGLERDVVCNGLCPATGTETCDVSGAWTNNTCSGSVSCDDGNACTDDRCAGGLACESTPRPIGSACESDIADCFVGFCRAQGGEVVCSSEPYRCPGTNVAACGVEVCVPGEGCLLQDVVCTEPRFFGVVRSPSGELGSVTCRVAGDIVECDMNGSELAVGAPACE